MSRVICLPLWFLLIFIKLSCIAGCEILRREICAGYGYNTTKLPNSFGHKTSDEAWQNFRLFFPLIDVKCSPQLVPFLCGLYFPPCHETELVPPCRSLCQQAQLGCESVLRIYGVQWPRYARCEKFPPNGLCFQPTSGKEETNRGDLAEEESGSGEQSLERTERAELPTQTKRSSKKKKDTFKDIKVSNIENEESNRGDSAEEKSGSGETLLEEKMKSESPTQTKESSAKEKKEETQLKEIEGDALMGSSCQRVPSSMCSSMGYNMTRFPNMLGHTNPSDSSLEIQEYYPLIKSGCSDQLAPFLCSVYFPRCHETEVVAPCRSLCHQVRSGCEQLMNKFGFAWPESLRCDGLAKSGRCFQSVAKIEKEQTQTNDFAKEETRDGEKPLKKTKKAHPSTQTKDRLEKERKRNTKLLQNKGNVHMGTICHRIPSSMCFNMGYNMTRFPNMLAHTNPSEASFEVYQYYPLVKSGCSAELAPFLCSLYFPQCHKTEVVAPCRSLCQQARSGCEPLINKFGFAWPENLRCDSLPESGHCFNPGSVLDSRVVKKMKPEKAKLRKSTFNNNKGILSSKKSIPKSNGTRMLSDEPIIPVTSRIRSRPGPHVRACLSFESDLCPKIPYLHGGFPNLLDHKNPRHAESQIRALLPLIKTGCSSRIMDFLCGVHFPECSERRIIAPCKHLCEEVSSSCMASLIKLGFRWPQRLACRNFPENGNCFGKGNEPIIVLPSSVRNISSPSVPSGGQKDKSKPGSIEDQPLSPDISPLLVELLNKAFMNPFMEWIKSSTVLNNDQAGLAVEQTKVAKLNEQKLGLEIDHLKKENKRRLENTMQN